MEDYTKECEFCNGWGQFPSHNPIDYPNTCSNCQGTGRQPLVEEEYDSDDYDEPVRKQGYSYHE